MARILSIEDDEDEQHLIGQALFRAGYEIHYAWNGREGYEKILSLDPDLILLDLMLPMMNGVELLKKLQESDTSRNIPVVIITAFGDDTNLLGQSVQALGAADYLRKPIQIQELLQSVKRVLAQSPRPKSGADDSSNELRKGSIRINPKFRTVWIDDRLIATLPPKEFVLFQCLLKSPGPVSNQDLLRELGYRRKQLDALKQTIHRLRKYVGPTERRRIQTTSKGYELVA